METVCAANGHSAYGVLVAKIEIQRGGNFRLSFHHTRREPTLLRPGVYYFVVRSNTP